MTRRIAKYFCSLLILCAAIACGLRAQDASSALTGLVTDPSGAAVPNARVIAAPVTGQPVNSRTNQNGMYEFKTLPPGTYTLRAVAKGFQPYVKEGVTIEVGKPISVNIPLEIATQNEKVEVQDEGTQLDVTASSNASSVVLKGKDLDALSDDPDDLQSELQALAGPSAGPNGGQIYIDGFTGGQLPPKSSIREIRINQNPFSAEYDHLGFGRIEVFTKPGTDKYHGQFLINGNTAGFNARNPFQGTGPEPGYDSQFYSANFGGPLSKKASFFLDFSRRNINELSVINTPALDANLNPIQFTDSVPNPRTRTEFSPRLDYQMTQNNTLTLRYQYERNNEQNDGIGLFSLPSLATNNFDTEHQIQATDTQIINAKVINETRFRFVRDENRVTPQNFTPTVNVNGAFTSGGSSGGNTDEIQDQFEVQNYTSMIFGKHFLKLGGRLRATKDVLSENAGFNGGFTFGAATPFDCDPKTAGPTCTTFTGLQIYQKVQQGIANGMTAAQVRATTGLGPTQFSITTGQAATENTYWDLGLYAQDEWKIKPNISFTYGTRIETQNQINNAAKVAPRIGLAWGIDPGSKGQPKTVLRAGWGIFYDRFNQSQLVQAQRLNGTTQQQFLVTNPDFFPNLPTAAELAASTNSPTIYQVDSNLKTPYTMQGGVTLERQLSKSANIAVTYLNSRGVHSLLTRNINAPVGPTFDPKDVAERPFGNLDNIYQYEGAGIFKQNQMIVNGSVRIGQKVSLFGYYSLSYANSDTGGVSSFPTNQFNVAQDYGRAAFDVRDRIFLGGSISMPYQFRLSPFLIASSGSPFNVTLGQDLNGDSIYNDRPTFAQLQTALATAKIANNVNFNCDESNPDTLVPINCGTGPARFSLNLRLSKTFGFGKKNETASNAGAGGGGGGGTFGRGPGGGGRGGGGGGRGGPFGGDSSGQKYSLTFAIAARNIFNKVNAANPVGVISSPIFGESNALAGGPFGSSSYNRRIDLQATFSF
ncbi:MAG TPA: carboxypeptidase regulatory-like domain-containing protein [Candidatus Dormibacteraeota bacterium]|nr:carboxypeptidase regulatory-like domain-containing protein [Candidatus Dormibacteraeota bacterium]